MKVRELALLCAVWLSLAPCAGRAAEGIQWPSRIGPLGNGQALPTDGQQLPVTWDIAAGRGVAWKVPIDGLGHSTPVIGNGKIWLTTATPDGKQQFVYCVDEASGEVVHRKLLFENAEPEPLGNKTNSYASPTCFLEADAVYAHFGTYGTARLNPANGDVVWQRRDINVRHFRGPGSSPIVSGDLLVLTFDGINEQFLTALNKHTGETVWKTNRTTDFQDLDENGKIKLDGDLRKAYCTPTVVRVGERDVLISTGARAAFGYDVRTGEELWTVLHGEYNGSAPPLVYQNTVLLNTGTRAHLIAVRLDPEMRGNVTGTHVAWDRARANSELSAPVLCNDHVYFLTGNGIVTCINAASGEEIWKERVGGIFTSAPLVAGNLIYCCDEAGTVTIIEDGDAYKLVAQNKLPDGMRASPVAANGALYLRTMTTLYKLVRD